MKIFFGQPSQHPETGELGARVFMRIAEQDGWSGHYEFDTHGLSPAKVKAKLDELQAYHSKKAARLDGFNQVLGITFSLGQRTFRIDDCTVLERAGEVELRIGARETTGGESMPVEGLPMRRRFHTIDDVPADGAIVGLVLDVIQRRVATDTAHLSFMTRTAALLPATSVPDLPVKKVELP